MGILLAFAPFIIFAIVDRFIGPTQGLCAAALASFLLVLRDWLTTGRHFKILELGTFLLFLILSLYALLERPDWSVVAVRLFVDSGLLLIVVMSIFIGRPFSMQYAQEEVSPDHWNKPEFKRANYVISGVWALAFAVMVIAELLLLFYPTVSHRIGIIAIVGALVGAVKFTRWYPTTLRDRVV